MHEVESLSPANLQPGQVDVRLELPCWSKEGRSHYEKQPSGQHLCMALREDHLMVCKPLVGAGALLQRARGSTARNPCTYGDLSKCFQQLGAACTVQLGPGWLPPTYAVFHFSKETLLVKFIISDEA